MSILPDPLHPAIVHLPIALAVLVPVFTLGALVAIRKGLAVRWAWSVPVAMLAMLLLSGWAALQTGGRDEDRMEDVVGKAAVESHEEAAEGFLVATGVVLLLGAAGFVRGQRGTVLRGAAAAGTLVLLGLGYNVGHSGGSMVYRDAGVTAEGAQTGAARAVADQSSAEEDDDDDDDDAGGAKR